MIDLSAYEESESTEYKIKGLICEKLHSNKGYAWFAEIQNYSDTIRIRITGPQFERLKIGDVIYHSWIVPK